MTLEELIELLPAGKCDDYDVSVVAEYDDHDNPIEYDILGIRIDRADKIIKIVIDA